MPEPTVLTREVETPKETPKEPEKVVEAAKTAEPAKAAEPAKSAEPAKEVIYSLKAPEGSKLGKEDVDRISAQAKEKGLSNDQAQMLLDAEDRGHRNSSDREFKRIQAESKKWAEDLKADKEIGGADLDKNVENASRVVKKYADKEFVDFLNSSGLGNHPMLVRMFAKLGKAFGEDHWVEGTQVKPKQVEKSAAEKMYDKTPKG